MSKEMSQLTLREFRETVTATHISKLREAVQPPGKKALWLKLLDDIQLAEVYHRLCIQKQPMLHVCRIVKEQWGIKPNWKPFEFQDGLKKFMSRISPELQKHALQNKTTHKEAKTLTAKGKKISKKIDGLGRLVWLINVQSERVAMFGRIEAQEKIPMRGMNTTIKTLGDLINMYLKRGMEMGVIDSVPSEMNMNIKHSWDQIQENIIKSDGNKMIAATQNMIDLAEKQSLLMRLNEDTGNYEVVNAEQGRENAASRDGSRDSN